MKGLEVADRGKNGTSKFRNTEREKRPSRKKGLRARRTGRPRGRGSGKRLRKRKSLLKKASDERRGEASIFFSERSWEGSIYENKFGMTPIWESINLGAVIGHGVTSWEKRKGISKGSFVGEERTGKYRINTTEKGKRSQKLLQVVPCKEGGDALRNSRVKKT